MSWVLLDDKFHSNEKTLEVGNAGAGLYARALSYCGDHLTDGFVPAGWSREAGSPALRRKLIDGGMWIEVKGGEMFHYVSGDDSYVVEIRKPGYFIPDFLALNPTRDSVLAKRNELSQKRAEAGRKGALKRWHRDSKPDGNGDGKPMANGIATEKQTDGPPPLPLPLTSNSTPPTPSSDATEGGNDFNEGTDFGTLKRLLALVPKDARDEARAKVIRTIKANRSPEADLVAAIEAAAGSNVRDPLAVILAELKKRAEARRAA